MYDMTLPKYLVYEVTSMGSKIQGGQGNNENLSFVKNPLHSETACLLTDYVTEWQGGYKQPCFVEYGANGLITE
jgi:hypothetical protein